MSQYFQILLKYYLHITLKIVPIEHIIYIYHYYI